MLAAATVLSLLAFAPAALAQNDSTSDSAASGRASGKRGIVYVVPEIPTDNDYWTAEDNDLTWYYNYKATPETAFKDSKMEFVPMLWGLPPGNADVDMTFYNAVQRLQQSQNVTWVMGFNEPDGCEDTYGASCIDPKQAAAVWIKQMEPMRKDLGIQLGGPACTGGPDGWTWLQRFHTECAGLKGNDTGCEMDFLPIHWYGNFDGLASHLGRINSTYSNVSSIWITEFAYANEDLPATQQFFNQSVEYFDRLDVVGKYSYFGPFRSDVSNVGTNVPFLNGNGQLTDIGAWYLGKEATGNLPTTTRTGPAYGNITSMRAGTYSGKPYSSANRDRVSPGVLLGAVAAVAAWTLF